jgi:hypothetical protein
MMNRIVFLGPQRLEPTAAKVLDQLTEKDAPVALVASGWQEAEAEEAEEIASVLARPVIQLLLHQRSDDIFHSDTDLFDAYRERQNELHRLQELHHIRLGHALEAARALMQKQVPEHIVEPEREAAIEAVRTLDQHHLERLAEVHERFESKWPFGERETIIRHRIEVSEQLKSASAVVIAGGHVAVLLYRMKLLGLADLIGDMPVVAWSAGAMALSDRVVLFHDSPPQGEGYPEILESGLSLAPGIVTFPHARRRLTLDDPIRVSLLARRFAPAVCVAMDEGAQVWFENNEWSGRDETQKLSSSGQMVEFN